MSEVSAVSQLVRSIISFAIGAALIGTLGDLVFGAKQDASATIKRGGMSYGDWNRKLLKSDVGASRNGGR